MSENIKVTTDKNSELYSMLNTLDNKFRNSSHYTTWIRFTCGKNLIVDTKLQSIQTSTHGNYSIKGNLLSSFNYQKNGSGQANSFTFVLYYSPELGDPINIVDLALQGTLGTQTECKIKFGYDYDSTKLVSPQYYGMVMDYSVELEQNTLIYTFTGYSGLATSNDTKMSNIKARESVNPISLVHAIFERCKRHVPSFEPYEFEVDKTCKSMCKEIKFNGLTDTTFFEAVSEILAQTRDDYTGESADLDKIQIEDVHIGTYSYIIDDVNHKFIVKRTEANSQTMKIDYTFYWEGNFSSSNPGANLVQGFRTDYKGSISMATVNSNKDDKAYSMDSENKIVTSQAHYWQDTTSGDNASEDMARQSNIWLMGTQYSYTATLRTVGVPYDIPIGTYIKVVSVLNDQNHHTSGIYMVTKTEDTIDGNGYITVWSLIKICGLNNIPEWDNTSLINLYKDFYLEDNKVEIDVEDTRNKTTANELEDNDTSTSPDTKEDIITNLKEAKNSVINFFTKE